jgi:hypothetical protein
VASRATTIGNGLSAAGALLLPLGAGAAGGYWIADRGVRWVPDTIGILLAVWLAGLIAMAAGSALTGPIAGAGPRRKRVALLMALAMAVGAVRVGVHFAAKPTPLAVRSSREFAEIFRADAAHQRDLDRTLAFAIRSLRAAIPEAGVLSAEAEGAAADAFAAYVDAAFALDQIRRFYEDYYKLDLSRVERDRHVMSFLLTFAAELSLFERTRDLIATVERNGNAEKFLEIARPERHLGPGSFTHVREELGGMTDLSRVLAGKSYLAYLDELHDARAEMAERGLLWLWRDVEERIRRIEATNAAALAVDSIASDFGPIQQTVTHVAFPVQKGVAEWMGDTRVKRAGRYLIGEDLQRELRSKLEPGDVLIARKNWYLSNVGLPGFWPHAMIYVGSKEELAKAFDADEATKRWMAELGAERFTAYLADRFPEAFRAREEHDLPIIEAISEGVSQSDLHHTVGDYTAALRPNLEPIAKARAIVRAFSFLGRPYDFDFDFATDDALVCTELVWRSYRTQEGEVGLHLAPTMIAGRLTLPANEFARVFRDERGAPSPQFAFVAFIEGREHHQDAVIADEAAFVTTVDRSKWDFGQP